MRPPRGAVTQPAGDRESLGELYRASTPGLSQNTRRRREALELFAASVAGQRGRAGGRDGNLEYAPAGVANGACHLASERHQREMWPCSTLDEQRTSPVRELGVNRRARYRKRIGVTFVWKGESPHSLRDDWKSEG